MVISHIKYSLKKGRAAAAADTGRAGGRAIRSASATSFRSREKPGVSDPDGPVGIDVIKPPADTDTSTAGEAGEAALVQLHRDRRLASPSPSRRSGRAAGSHRARAARALPAHGRCGRVPSAPPRPRRSRWSRAGTARAPAIVSPMLGMAHIGDRPRLRIDAAPEADRRGQHQGRTGAGLARDENFALNGGGLCRCGHASSVNTGLPFDGALDAVGKRAVEHRIAGVARRVMRELSGVGHQHGAGLVGQDRRDDDAGVGDDDDADVSSALRRPARSSSASAWRPVQA